MSHKMLRPFIVKVSVLGYFPLRYIFNGINKLSYRVIMYTITNNSFLISEIIIIEKL